MFLFLKSEETSNDEFSLGDNTSSVQFHPVMKRLQEFNVLRQKLKGKVEDRVDGLEDQVDSLMKAAEMMASEVPDSDEEDTSDEEDQVDANADMGEAEEEDRVQPRNADIASSSSDDESSVDEEARTRSAIHDARFGVRPNEMAQDRTTKRKRRAAPVDVGDDGEVGGASTKYLSSAINSIEQRAASKKKKHTVASEELVEQREADDQVRRGLEMMEEELGKLDSDEEGGGGEALADDIDSEGDDGFYSAVAKKSKRKKAIKKSLYQVAPKYPRLEGEVEGRHLIWFALRFLSRVAINHTYLSFCRRACY
jgi:U3 small nucleolar RNA-associated protein 3